MLPSASSRMTALYSLLSFILMSSVIRPTIGGGVGALRKNSLDNFELDKRLLQSYTNETTDYEDGADTNQDREVDFETCYGALQRADIDRDGRLETIAYLKFVQDYGSNAECLGDLLSLPVMPIELTACWNQLSCECRDRGGAPNCCEREKAHLPLSGLNAVGAPSGQTFPQPAQEPFIDQEQNFLKQTCLRTDQCILAYCGYPPAPIPVVPPVVPPPLPVEPAPRNLQLLWLLFLLLLLCCCCRRWFLCAAGKVDDDEEDTEQAPPVESIEEGVPPDENGSPVLPVGIANKPGDYGGDFDDPNANRTTMMSTAMNEIGDGGGVRYYRVVQEPEYEEPPPPPEPKVIDQYDKGTPEGQTTKLKHVERERPPTPPEDPYALEHYVPDGGIVETERTGTFSYEADGGVNLHERTTKEKSEWNRPGYERAAQVAAIDVDDRRNRNIDGYEGGAIFDHLDETDEVPKGGAGNLLEWVFTTTLGTLDDNQDDLRSETSRSETSR